MESWSDFNLPEWPYIVNKPRSAYVHFATDIGPGKTRKLSSSQGSKVSFQISLNGAQLQDLKDLYENNLTFTHENPVNDVVSTYRWTGPPVENVKAGADLADEREWTAQINLIKLP